MKELKPGDYIGGEYRIRRVFGGHGKSGMGVVYLVEGRSSEMPFVLKTFQASEGTRTNIERFKIEAETWLNIGPHPNVVHCRWVNIYNDQLFVAAEYIWPDDHGRNTLTHHIQSGGANLQRQLEWVSQFCFAMMHAQASGLDVHRDIKPDNLMIDNRGRLKVTDFGLARSGRARDEPRDSSGASGKPGFTAADSLLGTFPFMAPEQFRDASVVDHRADIYSFGAVLYMMLTGGRLPVAPPMADESSALAWYNAHERQAIPLVDHPLAKTAIKCLQKRPEDRFLSYEALLKAIEEVSNIYGLVISRDNPSDRAVFDRRWSIAMSLANMGRAAEAVPILRNLTEEWPDESVIYTELGGAYLRLDMETEAETALRRSLQIYPFSTAAWNNLAGLLANSGRLEEARVALLRSLAIDKENSGAMLLLAQVYESLGDLAKAEAMCDLALYWRPEKRSALVTASRIHRKPDGEASFFSAGSPNSIPSVHSASSTSTGSTGTVRSAAGED